MKRSTSLGLFVMASLVCGYAADDTGITDGSFSVGTSGNASYSIPIKCSPGTSGLQPTLSLSYDSQAPTASVGIGWSIQGYSVITRGAKTLGRDGKIEGVKFDRHDPLFLDGACLIPVSFQGASLASATEIEYRTELENYSKITARNIGPSGPDSFEVKTKAGLTMLFGVAQDGTNHQSQIKQKVNGNIFVWACDEVRDTTGNYMRFLYEQNQMGDYNLSEVLYTGNRKASPELIPYGKIEFVYTDENAPTKSYFGGEVIIKDKRLLKIRSSYETTLMREYSLVYENVPSMARFRLVKVQEQAHDGKTFAPTLFTYSNPKPGWTDIPSFYLPVTLGASPLGKRGIFLVDLDHDGRVDMLISRSVGGHVEQQALMNTSSGWKEDASLAPPLIFATETSPPPPDSVENGICFVDLDNDQRPDLLVFNKVTGQQPEAKAWLNRPGGWIPAPARYKDTTLLPPLSINGVKNEGVFFTDLNGDGLQDCFWSYTEPGSSTVSAGCLQLEVPTNSPPDHPAFTPNGGWALPGISFADYTPSKLIARDLHASGVWLVDVDGDGHPDLFHHRWVNASAEKRAFAWTAHGWSNDDAVLHLPGDPPLNSKDMQFVRFETSPRQFAVCKGAAGMNTFGSSSTGWTDLTSSYPLPISSLTTASGDDAFVRFVDITGDHRDDIVCYTLNENAFQGVYENTGSGFQPLQPSLLPPLAFSYGGGKEAPFFLTDLDGDGKADILYLSDNVTPSTTYLNRLPVRWQISRDFSPPQALATADKFDVGTRLVDFDGDGLTDIIKRYRKKGGTNADDVVEAWKNNANNTTGVNQGWVEAPSFNPPSPTGWEDQGGDWGSRFVDLNGDGLVDQVVAREGEARKAWVNSGIASASPGNSFVEDIANKFTLPTDVTRNDYGGLGVVLIDVNGDGLTDILESRYEGTQPNMRTRKAWINLGPSAGGNVWQADNTWLVPDDVSLTQDWIGMPPQYENPSGWKIPAVDNAVAEATKLHGRDCSVIVADINGDRLPDIIYFHKVKGTSITDYTLENYPAGSKLITRTETEEKGAYINNGHGWDKHLAYTPLHRLDEKEGGLRFTELLDVNGDGLPDLIYVGKDATGKNLSETYLNTGNGWTSAVAAWQIPTLALEAGDEDQGYRMVDVTGDGLVDILVHKIDESGNRRKTAFINNGATWVEDIAFAPPDDFPIAQHGQTDLGVRTVDVNGDGLPDLIRSRNNADGTSQSRGALINASRRRDTLQSITNGFNVEWLISFQSLSEPLVIQDPFHNNSLIGVYEPPAAPGAYPIIRAAPPAYIVTRVSVFEGGLKEQRFRYRYGEFKTDIRDARPLGFGWRETWNETAVPVSPTVSQSQGMRERCEFRQDEYALAGRSKSIKVSVPYQATPSAPLGLKLHQFTDNTWETEQRDALQRPDGRPYQIYTAKLKSTVSESHDLDGTLLGTQTDSFQFDAFGNVTETTTDRSDGTKAVTRSTFTDDPANWLLGRLKHSTVTLTGDGGASITRAASFQYDAATGVLLEEVAYAGTPKAVTTRYQYDVFGNKVASTVSAQGVQSRNSRVEFDKKGRFAIKGTNAIGQFSQTQYDQVLGVPVRIIDANGVTATTEYDSHGRKVRSVSPTGIATTMSYNWLPNGTPNAALIEVATQTGTLPMSKAWLDNKGRVLKTITTGTEGKTIIAETSYDILGRTLTVDDPHFGTQQAVSTQYLGYDILNRPSAVKTPDGKITRYRYEGYKTIVKDKLGRVSESETNLRKLPIRIKDPDGKVLRYEYDAADRLVRVFNPDGTRVENTYDTVGHRIQARDPDLGVWRYEYNALGELLSQRDAKGQVTRITYDKLSRPLQRIEADRETAWQYDTAPHGIGALAVVTSSDGYKEENHYDEKGRPVSTTFTLRGESFTTRSELDDYSRIISLTYPTGFAVQNVYDQWGFFVEVKDAKNNHSFWKADKFNEKGQVLRETFGNNVTSASSFSRTTRFLDHIETTRGNGQTVQKLDYTYDAVGNILARKDDAEQKLESFRYDDLDRLREVIQNQHAVCTLSYGASGNILKKSDTGSFDYAHNAAPAHGVKSITRRDGSLSQYQYDANGNMICGPKGVFEYTAANLVKRVYCGDASAAFTYSPAGAKYWEEYRDGHLRLQTLSVGLYERVNEEMTPPFRPGRDWMPGWQYNMVDEAKPGFFARKLATNERLRHRHYIAGPVGIVAVHEQLTEFFPAQGSLTSFIPVQGKPLKRTSRDTCVTAYMHRDALGSIKVLTDMSGNTIERLNYDAWGERQEIASKEPDKETHHTLRQGYTGHEHLDNLGLVHMNARVYDPDIGRFTSPDSVIDGIGSAAGYNRFAYVSNNPLRYTDPTGHWFGSDIWDAVSGAAGALWDGITTVANAAWEGIKWVHEQAWEGLKAAGKWIGENWKTIVVVVAVVVLSIVAAPLGAVAAGMICGAVSGGLSTALYGGSFSDVMESMFKGAVIGGVSAGAFNAVGDLGVQYQWAEGGVEKIAAHSLVGGGMEALQGGDFWHGALSAGITQGLSPQIGSIRGFSGDSVARVGAAAVVGGTTSAISGGGFANGAMTAAFSRAFNEELHFKDAIKHYIEGTGTPMNAEFSQLGADNLDAKTFSCVSGALETGESGKLSCNLGWSTKGSDAANTFGRVSLHVEGVMSCSPSSCSFSGRITALPDTYNFDLGSKGRTPWNQFKTWVGSGIPGKEYQVNFSGGRDVLFKSPR